MKYFNFLLIAFLVTSCNKKDVLLPKSDFSVVKEVADNSPIYIFFKIEGKDTIADVNRKNSIISTDWLLNVDRRLPLKLVIPEVMKLQEKKRTEKAHKNEKAENYYSYADSIGKNLAFLPFTKVYYKMEQPKNRNIVYFAKNNQVLLNGIIVDKVVLKSKLDSIALENGKQLIFGFDPNLDFGSYVQNKIIVSAYTSSKEDSEEYIF